MGKHGWFRAAGAVCLLATGPLSGCNKNTVSSTATQMATNPAGLCASRETLSALTEVIFSNIDVSSNVAAKTYVGQLKAGASPKIDLPVLDGYDKQINKVSCGGKLTVSWPNDITNKLRTISPGSEWSSDKSDITYTIQPQADGNGYVYSIDGAGSANIIGSVQLMANTLAQADQEAVATAEAAKAAAAQAAQAASAAATEVVTTGASASGPGSDGAGTPATTVRYSCSFSPDGSANPVDGAGTMVLVVDEPRACINNRTAYARTSNGGLARVMLTDADRRASVLSFSPDRQTFLRQDFLLNANQYAAVRQRGADLIGISCPVTADSGEVADTQSRLSSAHRAISPVLNGITPSRKMLWRCSPG